jgi:hypothetical protein
MQLWNRPNVSSRTRQLWCFLPAPPSVARHVSLRFRATRGTTYSEAIAAAIAPPCVVRDCGIITSAFFIAQSSDKDTTSTKVAEPEAPKSHRAGEPCTTGTRSTRSVNEHRHNACEESINVPNAEDEDARDLPDEDAARAHFLGLCAPSASWSDVFLRASSLNAHVPSSRVAWRSRCAAIRASRNSGGTSAP